jgi:thiol:disulfide interchange protein
VLVAALALAGLGLGLPLAAAAVFPRALARLAVGQRGREVLGFAMLASTVWLLYRLAPLVASETLAFVELGLLVLAMAAWLRRRAAGRPALRAIWGLLLALCAAAVVWLAAGPAGG